MLGLRIIVNSLISTVKWVINLVFMGFQCLEQIVICFIVGILRVWHYMFSPWLGVRCRFEPTCSKYSVTAYKRFGLLRGSILTIYRVFRCHPMCKGGHDPVPEHFGGK